MKKCNTCGFPCEDSDKICSNCGKNCDGSLDEPINTAEADETDEYKRIREQIRLQQQQILELQKQMDSSDKEEKTKKDKRTEPDIWDRTELFSEEDVKEHKLFAVLIYLTGIIGIALSLLMNKKSPYLMFHINQMLKIIICMSVLGISTLLLFWTFIVPIIAIIGITTLTVIKIISALWTAKGKSKEALIVRNLNILK